MDSFELDAFAESHLGLQIKRAKAILFLKKWALRFLFSYLQRKF
jgi:hypothetical protein